MEQPFSSDHEDRFLKVHSGVSLSRSVLDWILDNKASYCGHAVVRCTNELHRDKIMDGLKTWGLSCTEISMEDAQNTVCLSEELVEKFVIPWHEKENRTWVKRRKGGG